MTTYHIKSKCCKECGVRFMAVDWIAIRVLNFCDIKCAHKYILKGFISVVGHPHKVVKKQPTKKRIICE